MRLRSVTRELTHPMFAPVFRRLAATLALAACLGTTAGAADGPPDPIATAFRDWVARWKIPAAAAVVTRDGRRAATVAVGFRSAATPTLVGSLSKAITGLCVERLVEDGRLAYDGRIGALIPGFFARHPARDLRMAAITVAELALHTSGIALDPTQGGTDEPIDPTRPADEAILAAALAEPLKTRPAAVSPTTTPTTPGSRW